ncbi:hypothetical protein L1765_09705 [Microaerobacter geothermalis]|uniref:hypothetical protein n=1 Tax=Microaerobacter geothermalis TaxID=674972 RepID=UPI001F335BD2|nr:hypothetical protein [Microaerobacter geothermalis]MCF6094238.1 hypothetical protein [Microaerobacter geothermalis]
MRRILAYSMFMSFTMGFVHVPIIGNPLLTYIIGFVWSLIWLAFYIKEGKWEWFVSSVLTWQAIGLVYGLSGHNLTQLVESVGIIVSFSFGINAFISLFTSHPFTILFTRNIQSSGEGFSLRLH